VSTGKVERGGDKPFHTVINGENFHALEALTFTHRNKIDVIYIDPPYNTGAKDWKYNNDYVDGEDLYRHSKWLAMMERRLKLSGELLKKDNSVLIVTIDEKEFLRLGLLLEQLFPEAHIQMISSAINPKGSSRNGFRRSDEYIFFVMFGASSPSRLPLTSEWSIYCNEEDDAEEKNTNKTVNLNPDWTSMMRRGTASLRENVPNGFYPIYVDPSGDAPKIVDVGDPLPSGIHKAPEKKGLVTVLPIRQNGQEGRWQVVRKQELLDRMKQGRVRVGSKTGYGYVINYLPDGAYEAVCSNRFKIKGRADDGSLIAERVSTDDGVSNDEKMAATQWHISSHNASENGTTLINTVLGKLRVFDYAKSLYAVEDTLRFFVKENADAIVLDYFAGSGTTAHAVMRLNKIDGGQRQCISVTNNEVAAHEQKSLVGKGLRPGDVDWEKSGICDYVTKPRIASAVTGKTPEGKKIKGNYKFTDEFPMSEGFKENAEFFTLTYETPIAVSHNKAFAKIAPLLWMRAGSEGRRVEKIPSKGWDVADTYGVVIDLDQSSDFCDGIEKGDDKVRLAFIVTNDDRRFQSVARQLPDAVEPVRLYESYLNNFRFSFGR